ncbi:uncharacterized protein LOC135155130 [Lytechinus pictus]|uniref:uncharacterized protein LOC135155130 n=2 Tax=Lytechinus pictus TaxID=7653 RepID=UPI0030BA2A16
MSVCFGVQCLAPDDLILRSPVTYTLPHCAVAALYSSLQAVLYSGEGKYSPHAVIKERKVLSRTGIPCCKIRKDVLELRMDHFSWAKIKIMFKHFFFRGKRMCFVPFKEKNLTLTKTPLILHANFYDDVQGNKETVKSDQEELGYKPAYDEQHVLIKKAEVDLKVTYCVDGNEERSAIISFCRLIHGPKICEPVKFDVPKQPDNVQISMRAGQTKELEVNCSFRLDFPIPRRKENVPPQVGVQHGATSLPAQQTSDETLRINPARERDFDDILETVAEKVASRQDIHDLGKALGFGPEDIDRYVEENKKETGVSCMGTLSMLRKWRKKQTKNTELKALQTALEEAGEIRLADELFGE